MHRVFLTYRPLFNSDPAVSCSAGDSHPGVTAALTGTCLGEKCPRQFQSFKNAVRSRNTHVHKTRQMDIKMVTVWERLSKWAFKVTDALTTLKLKHRHEVATHVVSATMCVATWRVRDPVNTRGILMPKPSTSCEKYLPSCNEKEGSFIMNRHLSK